MKIHRQKALYYLFRALTLPLGYLPYSILHGLGKSLGLLAYYFLTDFRKRTTANLALATDLHLSTNAIAKTAKKSFQNFAITLLEYPRLAREKDISSLVHCENPQVAKELSDKGQGLIFFCGHQANWEVLFIEGNLHMQGTAMGKPFKNPYLYEWILSIREKTGGKIIPPQNALKKGLRTLKQGKFLGIVGDQSMPGSHYAFPFFGRRAWTAPTPALLAYKTHCPIIVATTRREEGKYRVHYSDPLWPNLEASPEIEVPRLMDASLCILQESIRLHPDQWLWQHNRYKQQTPHRIFKEYRHESLLIILPENVAEIIALLPHLKTLRQIYEKAFFFLLAPMRDVDFSILEAEEIIRYKNQIDMFLQDYRFKLVFNFSPVKKLKRHFLRYSAYDVLQVKDIKKKALLRGCTSQDLSDQLISLLCRKGSFFQNKE